MCRGPEQTRLQTRHADGQQTPEKTPHIPQHRGKAGGNHREVPPRPVRRAQISNSRNHECWRGFGERGPSCTVAGVASGSSGSGEHHRTSSKRLKIELPYDPAIPPQAVTQRKQKRIQKDTCNSVFSAAGSTVAKTRRQLKCPWTDARMKLWHVRTHTRNRAGLGRRKE